jgi:hypothetical protein
MGASLGILGAKVLRDQIARSSDLSVALGRFGDVMRPVIEHFHHTARVNVNTFMTEGGLKIAIRDSLLHLLPPSLLARTSARKFDVEEKLLRGIL